jgi:hypothetical protein
MRFSMPVLCTKLISALRRCADVSPASDRERLLSEAADCLSSLSVRAGEADVLDRSIEWWMDRADERKFEVERLKFEVERLRHENEQLTAQRDFAVSLWAEVKAANTALVCNEEDMRSGD